jgi:glyoxylase-like metal-dependent hydrolase (beta-lactamase superfamily II)
MKMSFIRKVVIGVVFLAAARGLPAQEPSTTLASAIEGRRVIEQVIVAIGGRDALRSVRSIETEESIRRIAAQQGMRPSTPDSTYGRRLVSFDVPGGRIAELRTLDLAARQLADNGRYVTPQAQTVVTWRSMTKDSVPQSTWLPARAAFTRRHFLPFLLSLERRSDAVRWLGTANVDGKPNDAVSVTDPDGILFTLLVDRQTHLPTRIEQVVVGSNVGDTVDVLQFSDYRRVGKLLLPHRRIELRAPDTEWDYRMLRFDLGTPIPDSIFTVPSGLTPAPAPAPSRRITLAPDVYLVPNAYQSVFVVFDEYVLVLEGGGSTQQTQNTIAHIKQVAPGKPIRYVVATHFHEDHLAGLRSFIAEGATIVTTADARAPIEALAQVRYRLSPDSLQRAPRTPVFEIVDRERVFRDARHEVRLHQIGPSPHVDQILIAYLPNERLLFEGDLLDIPSGYPTAGGDDTADFAEKVLALGLNFDRLIPVHGLPGTAADLEKALRWRQVSAKCPTGAERRTPCWLDPRPR